MFFSMAKMAAASENLVDYCLDALFKEHDRPAKAIVCRYNDVPREEPALESEPQQPGERRVLEDGLVCVGERKQGVKRLPLFLQLEKVVSEFTDPAGNFQRVENIFPQYIYKFDKVKNKKHTLKLREKAPLTSREVERDTFFEFDKDRYQAKLRVKYYYGGRLFSKPYAIKNQKLDCWEYSLSDF